MSNIFHRDYTVADGIHRPYSFEYADASARTGATGLTADDVGKWALQQDDKTLWQLTDESPVTWKWIDTQGYDLNAIHGNQSGEIAAITLKTVPTLSDLLLIEDVADSNNKKRITSGSLLFKKFFEYNFDATSFVHINPAGSDWAINAVATLKVDPTRTGLKARFFDDTTQVGVGTKKILVPSNAINISYVMIGRAATAPVGSPTTVMPKVYNRQLIHNTAWGAWNAGVELGAITIPITNAYYQITTVVGSLATFGLTAGRYTQFEWTRNPGSDSLVGDYMLIYFVISFT